jgi:hypothetical protein
VAKTKFAPLTERLHWERVSQPTETSKTLEYLPRRLAIPSLVLLKSAKFGTHPTIKARRKFEAGRIKERPGQVAEIHGVSIGWT